MISARRQRFKTVSILGGVASAGLIGLIFGGLSIVLLQAILRQFNANESTVGGLIGGLLFWLVWTAGTIGAMGSSIYAGYWGAGGEEQITVSFEKLTIKTVAGPFRKTRTFDLAHVISVRSELRYSTRPQDQVNWDRVDQRIAWGATSLDDTMLMVLYEVRKDGPRRRFYFGRELSTYDQRQIIEEIDRYRFPAVHWGPRRYIRESRL